MIRTCSFGELGAAAHPSNGMINLVLKNVLCWRARRQRLFAVGHDSRGGLLDLPIAYLIIAPAMRHSTSRWKNRPGCSGRGLGARSSG